MNKFRLFLLIFSMVILITATITEKYNLMYFAMTSLYLYIFLGNIIVVKVDPFNPEEDE